MKKNDREGNVLLQSFLDSMLKNISDLVFVKDMNLVYIGASKSFAGLVGCKDASEIVGRRDEDLFQDENLVRRYIEDDRRILNEGKALTSYVEPSEAAGVGRRYFQTSKYPFFNGEGRLLGLYGISKDVTGEYKAKVNYEQELRVLFELPENTLSAALIDITGWRMIDIKLLDDNIYLDADKLTIDTYIKCIMEAIVEDEEARKFFASASKDRLYELYASGKRRITMEYRRYLADGVVRWVRAEFYLMLDSINGNLCMAARMSDIEERKREEQALERAAEWDALTNAYNREATMKYISLFLKNEGIAGSHWLFMIDVDNFKFINETFGHRIGDKTLISIVAVIRANFRDTDIIGRIGGDEFFVLLKNTGDQSQVAEYAEHLVETLQYVYAEEGEHIDLSGSVGISHYAGNGKTLEQLYAEADQALFRAKHAGKNCFAFAEEVYIADGQGTEREQSTNAVHLKTLLAHMEAAVFTTELSEDGTIAEIYSSHRMFVDTEERCEGVRGENIWQVMLPEDIDGFKEEIRKAVKNRSVLDYICRIQGESGEIQWRHIRGTSFQDGSDSAGRMIHVVTDITKQKQVEAELREKDSILEFAMHNTDVNIWFFDYETNECQLTKSCQKVHEMQGVETLQNFPECLIEMSYVREDSADTMREAYERVKDGEKVELDAWFRKADDSGWWCERNMLSPLRSTEGKVTRGIGIGKNITVEKEMEKKFHIFQSYRSLAQKNTLVSVRMNLTTGWCGDYVSNEHQKLELFQTDTVDEFFHCSMKMIPTEEAAAIFLEKPREFLLEEFAKGRTSISKEFRCQIKKGSSIWVRDVIDMMQNPATGDVEALYHISDIDYEKNMDFVVERLLVDDYEYLSLIDVISGRVMVFGKGVNDPEMSGNAGFYEEEIQRVLGNIVLDEYYEEAMRTMSRTHVMAELETKEYYICSFPVREFEHTPAGRKQWKFSYLDESKSKLLMTRMDITGIYTAERDPLTGLYNRETFYRRARALLDNSPEKSFLLIRFDIDRFKTYNDVCGMQAGDQILANLGRAARKRSWPDQAVFGRLEADHFVSLMIADEFDVIEWHKSQLGFFETAAPGYRLTSSVGIYEVSDKSMEVSLMCDRALLALRTVKESYTRKLAWYDESLREKLMREQALEEDMERALEEEQFVVYFQPLINYESKEIIGAEALVRWHHPEQGIIWPGEFIPLFEKNGFILKLDAYVWEHSCEYLSSWISREEITNPVPVSVNISRCDLYDPEICERLYSLVKQYHLPFSMLKLEITETSYMDDPEQLIEMVAKFQAMGFAVNMDDFGAGYSSLNMLKDVPVDTLKLDTLFLAEGRGDGQRATTILSAIIHMAQELKLSIIAEGVETREQADYLKRLGCMWMQGYYFGAPMVVEKFEQLLMRGKYIK